MAERLFNYEGVKSVYTNMQKIIGTSGESETIAGILTDADKLMHEEMDVCDEALYGDLAKQILLDWENTSSDFPKFINNFSEWCQVISASAGDYAQFEKDVSGLKEANPLGFASNGMTSNYIQQSAYIEYDEDTAISLRSILEPIYELTGAEYVDTNYVEIAASNKTWRWVEWGIDTVCIAVDIVGAGAAVKAGAKAATGGAKLVAEAGAKKIGTEVAEEAAEQAAKGAVKQITTTVADEAAEAAAEAAAKQAAKEVAEEAAEKAAKEAAEAAAKGAADAAAKEAAAQAAKEAAEKAAKEAAEAAAKQAAKEAAEEAAEKAAKEAAEAAAEKAAKEAAEAASKEAASKTAKEAAEKASKEAAEAAAKEAAAKAAREAAEQAAKEAAEEAAEAVTKISYKGYTSLGQVWDDIVTGKIKSFKEVREILSHAGRAAEGDIGHNLLADAANFFKTGSLSEPTWKIAAEKAAKEAAEQASKDAAASIAEAAAKEAAAKAARETAEQVAKEAAAKAAAEEAAAEAAKQSAKEATEQATRAASKAFNPIKLNNKISLVIDYNSKPNVIVEKMVDVYKSLNVDVTDIAKELLENTKNPKSVWQTIRDAGINMKNINLKDGVLKTIKDGTKNTIVRNNLNLACRRLLHRGTFASREEFLEAIIKAAGAI